MKLRFLIYGSLLFVALALPFIYKRMTVNLRQQEFDRIEHKIDWCNYTANIEFGLLCKARNAGNATAFWVHWTKALEYEITALRLIQENLDGVKI